MKNINIIIAGCLVFGAGILASCGSDYLNTTPTKSIGTGTAIGTAKNAYKALNGIAKTMSTQQYAYSQGCAGENRVISSTRTIVRKTISIMHMHRDGLQS